MRVLHKDCDISLSKDKTLPVDSYLITYDYDGKITYDIVQSSSKVEIFDHYYDKYGDVLKSIKWTDGTVNPKLYDPNPKKKGKK